MQLINNQTGKPEEVPEAQATDAIKSGSHALIAGSKVPIRTADGQIGTIDASEYKQAIDAGGAPISHEEFRSAELDAKYGGVVGSAAAAGEGLARGLTVGLSDPLAVGAAGLVGGKKSAEAVRTHLAEEKEAHPYLAGAGEIAGAAAPVLLSGGAAGVAEGAEAASVASRGGALLRALGTPARLVGEAGAGAERVASAALDTIPGAEGAIARIGKAAIKHAASGATEGALFGAGNEISEDTLGDHQLTAEKFAAAMGHGALWGAMVGGGIGGGGQAVKEAAQPILNRIAPSLEHQADLQMWKALSPLKKYTKEAEARAGGAAEVGATLRRELDLPDNPLAAAMGPEELAPKIQEAIDNKWDEMRTLLEKHGGSVDASELTSGVDSVIAPLRKKAGFEGVVKSLESYKASLEEKLGLTAEGTPAIQATERVRRTPEELRSYLKENPEVAKKIGPAGQLPEEAIYHPSAAAPQAPRMAAKTVSVGELMQQRKALDEIVYNETKALDPNLRVGAMRDIRGKLADLELKAVDEAGNAAGEKNVGAELRSLRRDFQHLKIAQSAVDDTTARMVTNRHLSLSDNLHGAAVGAGMLAHGNVLGAAAGVATAYAHKAIREKGNVMAAVALGRLAKLDILARAANRVDERLDGAIGRFVSEKPKARVRVRAFGAAPQEDVHERYDRANAKVAAVEKPGLTSEHVERAIPGLTQHAPKTSGALAQTVNRGAAFLASQQPKARGGPTLLNPEPRMSEAQAAMYTRQARAVDDPVGTLEQALATGKVHADEVDAIARTKPALYAAFQQQVIQQVTEHRKSMTFEKVMTLSKLTKTPLDPTLSKKGVAYLQSTYLQGQTKANGQPSSGHGAPKRMISGMSHASTLGTGEIGEL